MDQNYSPLTNDETVPSAENINQQQKPYPQQGYIPPQAYSSQPMQPQQYPPQANPQPVQGQAIYNPIQNQVSPSGFIDPAVMQFTLKTTSVLAVCPYCKQSGMTIVKTDCSCANICCCICTSPICWLIFQAARSKDISCNNATHSCPHCLKVIGNYQAC